VVGAARSVLRQIKLTMAMAVGNDEGKRDIWFKRAIDYFLNRA
jgi:hypothetical protein